MNRLLQFSVEVQDDSWFAVKSTNAELMWGTAEIKTFVEYETQPGCPSA